MRIEEEERWRGRRYRGGEYVEESGCGGGGWSCSEDLGIEEDGYSLTKEGFTLRRRMVCGRMEML